MPDSNESQADLGQRVQPLMYAGDFSAALSLINAALKEEPESVDALYLRAVCHRYQKDSGAALADLQDLKRIAPEFGRAYQEEGHLFKALGDAQRAIQAYQRACQFNPALIASWQAQAELLNAAGRVAEAQQATAQANRLQTLPKELIAVTHLLYEGKLLKAEQLCRAYMQKHPRDVEGMRLLAEIGNRFGVLEDADFLLETAIELDPENIQLRLDFIQILRKRQKFEAALEQAKALYEREPENPLFQSHLAIESMQTGDYDRALELFETVLSAVPEDAATLTSRGHALKTLGEQERAVHSYHAAVTAKPDHGDAWYALANLKTYRFGDDELLAMREQEAGSDLGFQDRIYLCFALGKAYEDRKDYENAFRFYERGNDLKRAQTRYKSDQMEEELQAQAAICTRELFEKQSGKGCPAPDPIFILGLPRAGSTLVEQILASHSQVDGTLELPNILALSHRLRGRKRVSDRTHYPRILRDLDAGKLRELGEDYIENTRIHRQGAAFFTDKMPNNFRHIGLIKLILPNAKIIDARRGAMACCFSGFKQLFAEGQEFTYGLDEIGRYYRGYVELMEHWDSVLPGEILRVRHEDVVDDLETQVHRILDFCDLPFEQACIDFHKTQRAVRTASSEQVRQPIYKDGVEQWRHFEPWLDPLKAALGPELAKT
ncbi:sulfotransferase [Hyphobacterium sp. HN65]|uniref:Sulfotransferase n=2 Tax=Hyphobacterium lacteum TaxID=3116575 RepID=A0ABU7LM04_9PROT|nr:sulfotransferase [Hyphobacterium sp. HN65]MEE2524960.1 sulfotransferase [Hyphobacterium sp. HN65]